LRGRLEGRRRVGGELSECRAYEWLARYRAGGEVALQDHSATPARYHDPVSSERDGKIERLRRQCWTGDRIANPSQ